MYISGFARPPDTSFGTYPVLGPRGMPLSLAEGFLQGHLPPLEDAPRYPFPLFLSEATAHQAGAATKL